MQTLHRRRCLAGVCLANSADTKAQRSIHHLQLMHGKAEEEEIASKEWQSGAASVACPMTASSSPSDGSQAGHMMFEHEVLSSSHSFLAGINTAERGLSRAIQCNDEDEEKAKRVSDINVLVSKQAMTFDFPKS